MAVSRLHIEEWTDDMYMYLYAQYVGCIRNELDLIVLKHPTLVQLSAVRPFPGIKSVDACSNSPPPTDEGKAAALLHLYSPKRHSLRCA